MPTHVLYYYLQRSRGALYFYEILAVFFFWEGVVCISRPIQGRPHQHTGKCVFFSFLRAQTINYQRDEHNVSAFGGWLTCPGTVLAKRLQGSFQLTDLGFSLFDGVIFKLYFFVNFCWNLRLIFLPGYPHSKPTPHPKKRQK